MNMGGMAAMLEKLPMPGNINPAALKDSANEQAISAADRHHQFDDPWRKALPQDHQWVPQKTHCQRCRPADSGRQPPA